MRANEKLVAALRAAVPDPRKVFPVVLPKSEDPKQVAAVYIQLPGDRSENFKGSVEAVALFRVQLRVPDDYEDPVDPMDPDPMPRTPYEVLDDLFYAFQSQANSQARPFTLTAEQDFYDEDLNIYYREVTVRVS